MHSTSRHAHPAKRNGMPHTQVERTRGQAFEAGSTPVPRLFDNRRKRGTQGNRSGKGRRPKKRKPSLASSSCGSPAPSGADRNGGTGSGVGASGVEEDLGGRHCQSSELRRSASDGAAMDSLPQPLAPRERQEQRQQQQQQQQVMFRSEVPCGNVCEKNRSRENTCGDRKTCTRKPPRSVHTLAAWNGGHTRTFGLRRYVMLCSKIDWNTTNGFADAVRDLSPCATPETDR